MEKASSEKFFGEIRMHVESAENYIQVNQLCLHLKTVNNIEISSYNWSEKEGLIISLSLKNPVPLGDVLDKMPMIEQAYKNKKKEITVELNNAFPTTTTSTLKLSKECVPV